MHSEVRVRLGANQEFPLNPQQSTPLTHEAARRWLDDEFVRMDCEPLRASGKVLLADKVLAVASAAGAALLTDAQWSAQFAQATCAALSRPVVLVDVPARAVSF